MRTLEVKINKEIREYTESLFFGLNMRQCAFSALACIVAVSIYFLVIEQLGMEITSWLCMLGAAPFAALGFIKYQGMNAEQIVMTTWRSFLLSNTQLVSRPINLYYDCMKSYLLEKQKEELKKNDKKSFKNKKTKQR